MNTKYYANANGVNLGVLKRCIIKAIELANSDEDIERVILYGYTKDNLTSLAEIFGSDNLKNMFNTPVFFRGCTKPIQCATEIIYKNDCEYINSPKDVVVCCYMDSKSVFMVDDYMTAKYIIAMSWTLDGLNDWKKRWNAQNVLGSNTEIMERCDINPILQVALTEMNDRMYNTKALTHPNDAETCKTYIRTIHKYLSEVIPSEIKDFLVRELGWLNKNAAEVGGLLQRLKDGRTFQGGKKINLKEIYNNWTISN